MLDVWRAYHPDAEAILSQEKERLQANEKKRGPDNFMCQNLARVVQERYPRVLPGMGISPPELDRMNRSLYAYLSREAHARLRIDPVGYRISPDGSLTIVQRQANEAERRETALGCLDSSISEAIGALSYFLERRERERAEQIRLGVMEVLEESLPPGLDRDLGRHLAAAGVSNATIEFSAVPVYNLAVLPDGTASWSAGLRLGGIVFLATFDVPSARTAGSVPVDVENPRRVFRSSSNDLHSNGCRRMAIERSLEVAASKRDFFRFGRPKPPDYARAASPFVRLGRRIW
jgi:hypothetical protein